jgi:hypothetical protein
MTILLRTYSSLPLRHLPRLLSTMTILFKTYISLALRHLTQVWPTMTILFRTISSLRASELYVLRKIVMVGHT